MDPDLEITIGTDPTCDLVLDDPYVSKIHAHILGSEGRLWIEDRGSTNGTWINGNRVWTASLDAGTDRVRLGRTEWTVGELLDVIRNRFR